MNTVCTTNMSAARLWSVGLLAAALAMGCVTEVAEDETGSGGAMAGAPAVAFSPSVFSFVRLDEGESADATVRVSNVGDGPLSITGVRFDTEGEGSALALSWSRDAEGDFEDGILRDREDRFTYPLQVDAGQSIWLRVNLQGGGPQSPMAAVVLETDAPEMATVRIPVEQNLGRPQITVNPTSVSFGEIGVGQTETQDVVVTNAGDRELAIEGLRLMGSDAFAVRVEQRDQWVDGTAIEGVVQRIIPGEQMVLRVQYTASAEGTAGSLIIESNDPDRRALSVDLRGGSAMPCLEISPPTVEFLGTRVGDVDTQNITLRSCGAAAVEISLALEDGADPAFTLGAEAPVAPFVLGGPAGPVELVIPIKFTPLEARIHNGLLVIESDDAARPQRRVSLLGRGTQNQCPHAQVAVDYFETVPLNTVVLDGSPSVDSDGPDGRPVSYEWVVTSRPDHSISRPHESFFDPAQPANEGTDDIPSTPQAVFYVDLAGTYTFELRVTDEHGLSSQDCDQNATVTIEAEPTDAIRIELTWRTPADEIAGDDQGTDLDLHLLHPNAEAWFAPPHDCYFENANPDWGRLDDDYDDPTLDRDDTDGDGPETITLPAGENTEVLGRPYVVGVHYRSQTAENGDDLGPSFATVRLFVRGELAWENEGAIAEGKEMAAEDGFWDVLQFEWRSGEITVRDRYFLTPP